MWYAIETDKDITSADIIGQNRLGLLWTQARENLCSKDTADGGVEAAKDEAKKKKDEEQQETARFAALAAQKAAPPSSNGAPSAVVSMVAFGVNRACSTGQSCSSNARKYRAFSWRISSIATRSSKLISFPLSRLAQDHLDGPCAKCRAAILSPPGEVH